MDTMDPHYSFRKHYNPRRPHFGLIPLDEAFAMDTIFPQDKFKKVNDFLQSICAQIFVGLQSSRFFCVWMCLESERPGALQDFIQLVGCPNCLHSDNSQMQLSKKVKQICRDAYIPQSTTEPHTPWKNPAEREIQEIKKTANFLMNYNSAHKRDWCFVLLHTG